MMAENTKARRVANQTAVGASIRRTAGNGRKSCVPRNCEPVVRMPAAAEMTAEATPIWMAALIASQCQAVANGADHAIRWNHVSGRALYTNSGTETETIQPFGVCLKQGQTVAVSWVPGETAYTVEVYRQYDLCA